MGAAYFAGMAIESDPNGSVKFCLMELASRKVVFVNTVGELAAIAKKIPGGFKGKITFIPPQADRDKQGLAIRYYNRLSTLKKDEFKKEIGDNE